MNHETQVEVVIEAEPAAVAVARPTGSGSWSFRDRETGAFTGRTFRGPARLLERNTPPGCEAVPGIHVTEPPRREEDPAAAARLRRARLLAACDWVVTRANETDQPVPDTWAAYRQALRDVPSQPGFPAAIDWPAKPE